MFLLPGVVNDFVRVCKEGLGADGISSFFSSILFLSGATADTNTLSSDFTLARDPRGTGIGFLDPVLTGAFGAGLFASKEA